LGGYLSCNFGQEDVLVEVPEAVDEFYLTFNYSAADVDSVRDTDEVSVLEFYAGALVTVV